MGGEERGWKEGKNEGDMANLTSSTELSSATLLSK